MSALATEDICPVSAADICPVPTADICPVSTETSVLSQEQTFGPEPAEFWPGTRGIL